MIIPLILFGLAALMIGISLYCSKHRSRKMQDPHISFTVSVGPVKTVYDDQTGQNKEIMIADTSNGRKIDGHPLRTPDDWARWSEYDDQARECQKVINNCQKALQSTYCKDPDAMLAKVKETYAEYERLCLTYGMWNLIIGDRETYIPTEDQRKKSQCFLENVENMVPPAKEQKTRVDQAKKIAYAFVDQYQEKAYRTDLARKLSSEMEINSAEANKVIRILCNINALREEKNEKGRIYVRRARKKSTPIS